MKQLILHGPAISASRKKLIEIKKKYDPNDVVVFEKEADSADILASLQTVSLFSENRLVIVENPAEDLMTQLSIVNFPLSITLVLWFDHEMNKFFASQIKKIPQSAQVFFFPEAKEASIFPFLDKLGSKDKGGFLEMAKLKKAGLDTQYLITMILYLLRNLVATPKGAKEFVKNKNGRMRKNFSPEELVNLYKYVLEVDFKIKSGVIEPVQAEFLLVNMFTH